MSKHYVLRKITYRRTVSLSLSNKTLAARRCDALRIKTSQHTLSMGATPQAAAVTRLLPTNTVCKDQAKSFCI